ncbi:riboflavin synthase [Helicobacter mehlei]|uniref:Riboflavin synthase n=1 Tax=Helicobacter mehlei TaxID=2316080 RepID=A0A553V3G2_9HELI|nr:riboflavin synthase [Helicobacter mehlei]TSA86990.1 riboflavin synthase [Helicobacter mehlei]
MFSGLIYQVAQVKSLKGDLLEIKSDYIPKIGDSIAINGACLSVVALNSHGFSLQLSQYTQESIALENYQQGALVNLEPALLANSRLDGHLVQGHVDGIGIIEQIKSVANQISVQIQAPPDILKLCIPKGSIAIDGVSLTLASVGAESLELVIIPLTFNNTLFKTCQKGRRVNIETDMLVRSVAHLLAKQAPMPTWQVLDALALAY